MKKIMKGIIFGILGGLLYAFISFYLITPILRKNIAALAFWGLQGFIFGIVYVFLKLITEKTIHKRDHKLMFNIIVGTISGFLSSSYHIIITSYNALINVPGILADGVKISIISELIHFSLGSTLIGLIIGSLIGLRVSKGVEENR